MITMTVFRTGGGTYQGFLCSGHAGYAKSGEDIVCAAVSILVINTVNAIERYGNQEFACDEDTERGMIRFTLKKSPTEETKLLLDTMLLGLKEVEREYHGAYLKLIFREV